MRILLVEDDPTTSKSIELMLTHANLNVYATDLGEEFSTFSALNVKKRGGLQQVRKSSTAKSSP